MGTWWEDYMMRGQYYEGNKSFNLGNCMMKEKFLWGGNLINGLHDD